MSGPITFVDEDGNTVRMVSLDHGLPVEIVAGGTGGGGGMGDASEATLLVIATNTDRAADALESTGPATVDELGAVPFKSLIDNTAGAISVLGAAGHVVWMHVYNSHATDTVYLHLFDATSVTLNTTEPVLSIPWKAGQAGWAKVPTRFTTGIRLSAHPTFAKSATAPAASLTVNLGYRAD